MTPIFLGLGSNIEREQRLVVGSDALAEFVRDLRCSPVFEPSGRHQERQFLQPGGQRVHRAVAA